MKRSTFVALGGFLVLTLATPGAAQIPARGLSVLICLAGVQGNGTYEIGPAEKLVLEVSGDSGSSATVHIIHGGDDSTHVLTYDDANQSGVLDCRDRILTVS